MSEQTLKTLDLFFSHGNEIIAGWNNDRHQAVTIRGPGGPDEVADALHRLAELIRRDPVLRN